MWVRSLLIIIGCLFCFAICYAADIEEEDHKILAEQKKLTQGLEKFINEFKEKSDINEKKNKKFIGKIQNLEEDVKKLLFKAQGLNKQKALIEGNSIRLYEVLVDNKVQYKNLIADIDKIRNQQIRFENILKEENQEIAESLSVNTVVLKNALFILFTFLIFPAFALNVKNTRDVLSSYTVLLVTSSVVFGYSLLYFGLKYAEDLTGNRISELAFFMMISPGQIAYNDNFLENLLYKMSFILFPVLVFCYIVKEQFSSIMHIIFALFAGMIFYPAFGYWMSGSEGWLMQKGMIDLMHSLMINVVPAWFACVVLYQRRAMWKKPAEIDGSVYSSGSAFLLLFSFFGFALHDFAQSGDVFGILFRILLAASAGGLFGFLLYALFHVDPVNRMYRLSGGFVSGLVAVTACVQVVTFAEALIIGAVAGALQHVFAILLQNTLLHTWQVSAAYLVAIHVSGGIWGILAAALFGSAGNFSAPDTDQLLLQLQGIGVALIYSTLLGLVLGRMRFFAIKKLA